MAYLIFRFYYPHYNKTQIFIHSLGECKTLQDIVKAAEKIDIILNDIGLLVYQALNILTLDEAHANLVAQRMQARRFKPSFIC